MAEQSDEERQSWATEARADVVAVGNGEHAYCLDLQCSGDPDAQCALRPSCVRCHKDDKHKQSTVTRTFAPDERTRTEVTQSRSRSTSSTAYSWKGYTPRHNRRLRKNGTFQNGTVDKKLKIKLQIILPGTRGRTKAGSEDSSETRRVVREYRKMFRGYGLKPGLSKLFMGGAFLVGAVLGAGLGILSMSIKEKRATLQDAGDECLPEVPPYSQPSAPTTVPSVIKYAEPATPPQTQEEQPPTSIQSSYLGSSISTLQRSLHRSLSDGAVGQRLKPSAPSWPVRSASVGGKTPLDEVQNIARGVTVLKRSLSSQGAAGETLPPQPPGETSPVQPAAASPSSSVSSLQSCCFQSCSSGSRYLTPSPGPAPPAAPTSSGQNIVTWLRDASSAAQGRATGRQRHPDTG